MESGGSTAWQLTACASQCLSPAMPDCCLLSGAQGSSPEGVADGNGKQEYRHGCGNCCLAGTQVVPYCWHGWQIDGICVSQADGHVTPCVS